MQKKKINNPKSKTEQWFVYILQCSDKTLYTGITNELERRINAHESGKGAKYTRGRTPLKLIYSEKHKDKSSAAKREYKIKSMERADKLALVKKKTK